MAEAESSAYTCLTGHGRPAFVVNVEVFLHRDGRWLLIRRSMREAHAAGLLSGVGGKVEPGHAGPDVLEQTARREVAEEIGVDLTGITLAYAQSAAFVTDDGDPVVNIVLVGVLPASARPVAVQADEVAGVEWRTLAEAERDPNCPPWTLRGLRAAAAAGQAP